jgi:2-haloacid dehalogenase
MEEDIYSAYLCGWEIPPVRGNQPHPQAYRLALEELKVEAARALFVAGSPADLPGATSVGMPVFWHNRLGLPLLDSSARPKFVSDSLWSLIEVVGG